MHSTKPNQEWNLTGNCVLCKTEECMQADVHWSAIGGLNIFHTKVTCKWILPVYPVKTKSNCVQVNKYYTDIHFS